MPAGQLHEALAALKAGNAAERAPPTAAAAAAFAGCVVTGTGFWGADRAALRELAARTGLAYSGDLVRGRSTHLVLAPAATASCASRKLQKAAEWGVPVVRLPWLLDSAAAGRPLPVQRYLLDAFDDGTPLAPRQRARQPAWQQGADDPGWAPEQLQLEWRTPDWQPQPQPSYHPQQPQQHARAGGQQQGQQRQPVPAAGGQPGRPRPSSVASNALALAGGAVGGASGPSPQPAAASAACPGSGSGHQQQVMAGRPALAQLQPNLLADQLRRMSISPEPQQQARPPPAQQQQQQQQPQQQGHRLRHAGVTEAAVGGASPPPQRSPSPQRSLSLQGLVGGAAAAWSPAEVGSGAAPVTSTQRSASPETDSEDAGQEERQPAAGGSPMLQSPTDALQQPSPAAPMQDSPWGAAQQQQQQQADGQQAPDSGALRLPARQASASPMAFSLAAALGRSISEEQMGSPMAESPAAAPEQQAQPLTASTRLCSGGRLPSPAPSSAAGTPAGGGSQGQPMCSMPTPACIREWTDDDSMSGTPADVAGTPAGITQTPPAVRQALAAVAAPTQLPPLQQQQEQQEQQATPGARVQDWPDDAAAASGAPPSAGELVISDSETDDDLTPPPPRHQPASHQAQQQPQPEQAAMEWPQQQQQKQQQPAAECPQQQQQLALQPVAHPPASAPRRKGLLLVSSSSAAGGKPRAPAPPAQQEASSHRLAGPSPPAAAQMQPPAEPSPVAQPLDDEPMPIPGDDAWEPAQPSMSGYASPAASCLQGPGGAAPDSQQQPQQQQQRRQQQGAAAPSHSARAGVRDWSEGDDISSSGSEGEFPTPKGARRTVPGGLTGLTQLDPSAIVIARPKAAGGNWRGGGGGGQPGDAVGLKLLQRPPRGNAVRQHHALPSLKGVQFAEQVQVPAGGTGLLLSTKDKKTAVRLRPGGLTEEEAEEEAFQPARPHSRLSSGSAASAGAAAGPAEEEEEEEPVLAEPQTFYRLADGSWHLEYCRFWTAAQAEAAARAAGASLALPPGFDRRSELLKAVERQHAPLSDVAAGVQVRRVKAGGTALRLRGGTAAAAGGRPSWFWRSALDTDTWRVVTDRKAADFVAVE